jgi:rod shape-determining protein MreC
MSAACTQPSARFKERRTLRTLLEKKDVLVFALLSLLCVVFLNLPVEDQARLARRANRLFLLPWLLVKEDVEGYVGLREENVRLREALERRSLEVAELQWTRIENLKLRDALVFRERLPVQLVAAEVIASSGERFPRTFLINKGSSDGVRPDQPVVIPDGLVGKTVETDARAALVMTVRHPDFRASALALTEKEAQTGIAAVLPDGDVELIVPMRSTAREGDRVVTSGIGPVFPRGIPIGRISDASRLDRLKLQKSELLVPAVDLHRVTSVFVIVPSSSAHVERTVGPPSRDRSEPGGQFSQSSAELPPDSLARVSPAGESVLFWPGSEGPPALAADSLSADSLATIAQ